MLILVKTLKKPIWVKIYNNFEFGQNFYKNPHFCLKLSEILDFGQNLPKYRFWTKW